MSSALARTLFAASRPVGQRTACRTFSTSPTAKEAETSTSVASDAAPNTHFKVTLKRSAISLGDKKKGTLLALGFHRRFQTVYHRHTPEAAGMILSVKELVEVENVPEHMVKTKQEMRQERKAPRGYQVVSSRRGSFLNL
ncbi:ribosomal protein L30 [Coprinopsis cinerea AmutBmut pab1-1]|nr:ribosomal protein L30 [Coprinopsis cinerea AmutBmut pab1-1]